MSFDLIVLAMDKDATESQARLMLHRCQGDGHAEADIDERIMAFYADLTSTFPDHPPYDLDSPWAMMPLGLGVDHVFMYLRHGPVSDPVVDLVERLAARHHLVLIDPQGDDVYLPATFD